MVYCECVVSYNKLKVWKFMLCCTILIDSWNIAVTIHVCFLFRMDYLSTECKEKLISAQPSTVRSTIIIDLLNMVFNRLVLPVE